MPSFSGKASTGDILLKYDVMPHLVRYLRLFLCGCRCIDVWEDILSAIENAVILKKSLGGKPLKNLKYLSP